MQACLNERPSEGLGEVLGGLRGVMEAEALQLNTETQALHALKVPRIHSLVLVVTFVHAVTPPGGAHTIMLNSLHKCARCSHTGLTSCVAQSDCDVMT